MTTFFRSALIVAGFYIALVVWGTVQASRPTQIEIIRVPESTSQGTQKTNTEKEETEEPWTTTV